MVGWLARGVLLPFAATRAALLAMAVAALTTLPVAVGEGAWADVSAHPWVNVLARWDARWYISIVEQGYVYEPGQVSNVAFWPLYPALLKGLALLSGRHDREALAVLGALLSNAALVVGLVHLALLVRLDFDRPTATRTVLYVLLWPGTLFLSVAYPMALSLALAVASLYHARRGRWWLAGSLAALAAFARPTGILLMAPLALEMLAAGRRLPRLAPLALALPPAAVAVWSGYLWLRFGNPLAFLDVQTAWRRRLAPPWETLGRYLAEPPHLHDPDRSLLDLTAMLLICVLVALGWRWLRRSLAVYATLVLAVLLLAGSFMSTLRLSLEAFPALIVLAVLARRGPLHLALTGALGSAALFLAMVYAVGYWVA